MMPETAGDDPAAGAGCEELRDRMDPLIDQAAAILADLGHDPGRQDMARRLSLDVAAWREFRSWLDSHVMADELLAAAVNRAEQRGFERGLAAARAPGQRKGRHASASLPQRALRIVTGIAGALGLTGVLRHLLAASPAVKGAVAVSLTAVTLTAGAVAVIPGASIPLPFGASPAGTPAPAASIEAAVPIAPPSSVRLIHAMSSPGAKPGLEVKSSGTTAPDVPPSCYCAPPAEGPAPSSQPSQPSQSSAQSDPVTLTVSTSAIDLSSAPSATIQISATGGTGWATWKISTWDPATQVYQTDLDFSRPGGSGTSGVLTAGESVTVTVTLDPGYAGVDTQEVFTVAGQSVTATLPGPQAAASPSPAPTDTAVPDPTSS